MFSKILIANRGEIACRIIKTCKTLGIKTAVIYSQADKECLHVKLADEAYLIGPPEPEESYLRIDKIIETAKKCDVEAIHPGYGFLAERADFAEACEKTGIKFIGPISKSLKILENKVKTRELMKKAGVKVIPGSEDSVEDFDEALRISKEIGFPALVKASYGGGGRGLRIARNKEELKKIFEIAKREAEKAFGKPEIYIEKYIEKPRHIEFQILADEHGNVIHLGERECSIQRRYQKLLEETPSPALNEELKEKMGEAAIKAAKTCGYTNAGTIEFQILADMHGNIVHLGERECSIQRRYQKLLEETPSPALNEELREEMGRAAIKAIEACGYTNAGTVEFLLKNGEFYFLEVNKRIQVEHLITELVTGIDLVEQQIRIASGEKLKLKQQDITMKGWAIDCRINCEDPQRNFLPYPGKITRHIMPKAGWIRIDTHLYEGYEIPYYYDSLIAKVAVKGRDRKEAIQRMKFALENYVIEGVPTTIPFHLSLLENRRFLEGNYHTELVEEIERLTEIAAISAAIAIRSLSPFNIVVHKRKQRKDRWTCYGRKELMKKNYLFGFKWSR